MSILQLTISGAIPAPYYDLADPDSMKNWETSQQSPGLYADIRGKNMRFTVPAKSLDKIQNLEAVLQDWDKGVSIGFFDYKIININSFS